MRVLSILLKIFLGIILFLFMVILFIRSPWGQGIIKDKAISYLVKKTHTTITLDRLFLTFSGNIRIDALYVEDLRGDTLLFSEKLVADIPLWPIITQSKIDLNFLEWSGVRANIYRTDSAKGFNYQFLADAFSSDENTIAEADTSSAGMTFSIGKIHFSDIRGAYLDQVAGTNASVWLGDLNVKMKDFDLEKMIFSVASASLDHTRFKYVQTKPTVTVESESSVPFPTLSLQDISINQLTGIYQSDPDDLTALVDIQNLNLNAPIVDLNRQEIEVVNLGLHHSEINVHMPGPVEEHSDDIIVKGEEPEFLWPDWKIRVGEIVMEENKITFTRGENQETVNRFDPDAIHLSDLNFHLSNLYLEDRRAGVRLEDLSFREGSGIEIDEFSFDLDMTDQSLVLQDFSFQGVGSRISGAFTAEYSDIAALVGMQNQTRYNLDFPEILIDLKELKRFSPELEQNEYISILSQSPMRGMLHASGSLATLRLEEVRFDWGHETRIFASGNIRNPMTPERLRLHLPILLLESGERDLAKFIKEEDIGIKIPEKLRIDGNLSGSADDMTANGQIRTTLGNAEISGGYQNTDHLAFELQADISEFRLDSLLQTPQLGLLSATIDAKGSGKDLENLNAHLDANILQLEFNHYLIEDWTIAGKVENGRGTIHSGYKDQNINASLKADFVLDSIAPSANLDLEVRGADLAALGVMQEPVAVAFNLHASGKGNQERYEGAILIESATVVHKDHSYKTGNIDLRLFGTQDTTAVELSNSILNFSLYSNSSFAGFSQALTSHINEYLQDTTVMMDTLTMDEAPEAKDDTLRKPVRMDLDLTMTEAAVLKDVFLKGLEKMDTLSLKVAFDESMKNLDAQLHLPYLLYSGIEIDSVHMITYSNKNQFDINLGLQKINAGPVTINSTGFHTRIEDQKLFSVLNAKYEDKDLVLVHLEAEQRQDSFLLHLHPDSLIVDSKHWNIPSSNRVIYTDSFFHFRDFVLSHNNQQFRIDEDPSKNAIRAGFENFELDNIVSYFNPDTMLASGRVNGFVEIYQPLSPLEFNADIQVKEFKVYQADMGTLVIMARSGEDQDYQGKMTLAGSEVELSAEGRYFASGEGNMEAHINIDHVDMVVLEGFSFGELKDGSGFLTGNIDVSGTVSAPEYSGEIFFSDAGFNVAMLDAPFVLKEEMVRFDNNGIRFEDFKIRDEEDHVFMINGHIGTENFLNPVFDLQLEADDFQILNSRQEDNNLFYGRAVFDVNAMITGDLKLPKVDLRLDIGDQTNITYIMPQAQAKLEKREGIVVFVNKENPEDILSRQEDKTAVVTGYDINAVVSVGKEAVFEVIINEETGDYFMISGEGDLNFSILPNGQVLLTGLLEIENGHYEMNLYNLVTRRFDIVQGSKVSWSGDMMDASLDVSTRYRVEASPYSLMAPRTSGADVSVKNQYRRKLPFLVYLNIGGSLNHPNLDFNIDMPEDAQGASGGQVYGRIQELNAQEQELNKQVFSLLVLGQFYPDSGSDGSGGGIENVARDNLNQALSDQLNMFSDRLLGDTGVELDFGLDTYTDYEGGDPQRRTELDIAAQKKFLNDRLIVKVGSEVDVEGGQSNTEETNPLIGNVSVEYLLTEKGNFRIRGFRKNTFENVIDGQTIVSGLALIFTQEFNKFDQLWRAMFLKREKESDE